MTTGPGRPLKIVRKDNSRPGFPTTAWWLTIKASNGKPICHSEQYASKRARDNAVSLLEATGGNFKVVDS